MRNVITTVIASLVFSIVMYIPMHLLAGHSQELREEMTRVLMDRWEERETAKSRIPIIVFCDVISNHGGYHETDEWSEGD